MQYIRALLFIAAFLLAGPAVSGEAGIKAAQDTIDAQMRAFKSDDGDAAYSYAAPSIRRIFPTADIFMSMVENAYRPVRDPRSYAFGKAQMDGNVIVQDVLITGPDGKEYEAVYKLELQPDGVYRITSVTLKPSKGLSA